MPERAPVPIEMIRSIAEILNPLPRCAEEDAWTGVRWRVGQATIAHVFGGEDGLIRVTFRAAPDEVMAFAHMGAPYFKADWGSNVVGLVLDETTDWTEMAELLVESYCLQAPAKLVAQIERPG